jgi:hypothetical protein
VFNFVCNGQIRYKKWRKVSFIPGNNWYHPGTTHVLEIFEHYLGSLCHQQFEKKKKRAAFVSNRKMHHHAPVNSAEGLKRPEQSQILWSKVILE